MRRTWYPALGVAACIMWVPVLRADLVPIDTAPPSDLAELRLLGYHVVPEPAVATLALVGLSIVHALRRRAA